MSYRSDETMLPNKFDILDRMVRQGDVLLYPIDAIPADAFQVDNPIVAFGEKSGHKHQLHGQVQVFQTLEKKPMRTLDMKQVLTDHFVRVVESTITNPAELVHENKQGKKADHEAKQLKVGDYMVVREEEFSPFEEQIRRVED